MAFKVFNNREAEAEVARQARLQQKVAQQTQAMLVALQPAANTGTGGQSLSPPKERPTGGLFQVWQRRTLGPPVSSTSATNEALPRVPTAWPLEGYLSP